MKLTGAQVIAQAMKNFGVQYVAGVPGRDCLPLLDAFLDAGREIPFIQVMQSRSAVHLADGFYRACGRPMALIGGASGNDMPMPTDTNVMEEHASAALLIGGRETADSVRRNSSEREAAIGPRGNQASGMSSRRWSVPNAGQLPDVLQSAFSVLLASQPKPVQVEVPLDAQVEPIEIDNYLLHAQPQAEPSVADRHLIEKAADLLLSSMRPVIFVGIGTEAVNAKDAVLELAMKVGAMVVTSAGAKGVVPEDHPISGLSAGRLGTAVGNSILARADWILVVGCKDADWTGVPEATRGSGGSGDRKLIRLSLALPPGRQDWELDIEADVSHALRDMSQAISPHRSRRALSRHSAWLATTGELKVRWLQLVADRTLSVETPFSAQRPISKLREVMDRDGVVVAGPGTALMAVQQAFRAYLPRTQLTCANSPVVGWAVPAAIGAKLAVPAKDVVCVVGDGDFLQSLPEMAVCVMHGLPLVFVVLNNCGHMSTRFLQQKLLGRYVGSEFNLPNGRPYSPNFSDIARSFGLEAWRVEHDSQLEGAMKRALSSGGPALVEILTAREDYASLAGFCGDFGYPAEKKSISHPEGSAVE